MRNIKSTSLPAAFSSCIKNRMKPVIVLMCCNHSECLRFGGVFAGRHHGCEQIRQGGVQAEIGVHHRVEAHQLALF